MLLNDPNFAIGMLGVAISPRVSGSVWAACCLAGSHFADAVFSVNS
jgi:hypothetical protein